MSKKKKLKIKTTMRCHFTHTRMATITYIHTYIYLPTYIHICIYIYVIQICMFTKKKKTPKS